MLSRLLIVFHGLHINAGYNYISTHWETLIKEGRLPGAWLGAVKYLP